MICVKAAAGCVFFIVGAAAVYGAVNAILQLLTSARESSDFVNTANAAILAGIAIAIAYALTRVGGDNVAAAAPAAKAVTEASDRVVDIRTDSSNFGQIRS